MTTLTVIQLVPLLGHCLDEDVVQDFLTLLGPKPSIERSAYYGFLEYKRLGIAVMFKEMAGHTGHAATFQPLRLSAFHLYANGVDGYHGFSGELVDLVHFGDERATVIAKMGPYCTSGGGNRSVVLDRILPQWDRYDFVGHSIRFQYSSANLLEMVTVFELE